MNLFKVLVAGAAIAFSGATWAGAVNVNTADAKTIAKELNGVGDKTAAAIVAERSKGAFKDAADMKKRVKGVGDKTLEKNKTNLTFAD